MKKTFLTISIACLFLSNIMIIIPSERISADPSFAEQLADAILVNSSWLVEAEYYDRDEYGNRQAIVLSERGKMKPIHGPTFALLSTGIAGTDIATTDEEEPGSERGEWFEGGSHGYPRDEANLTLTLLVPDNIFYLYYDVQFFSSEYPEYVGTQYNDKLTIKVYSPSGEDSEYSFDVNSGYFLLESDKIPGTGFDIFARSGYPGGVDYVDTIVRYNRDDAGASGLIQIGGIHHPVVPGDEIKVSFVIKDSGDNQFDSAAFIDNLRFSEHAEKVISARKTIEDLDSNPIDFVRCNEQMRYRIIISNTGESDQQDNTGNEFEDVLPDNVIFIEGSETKTSGVIDYIEEDNKIIWNGAINKDSSVILTFDVTVNDGLPNGTVISNQGIVNWDSNGDNNNDAIEYTDDPYYNDSYDKDGDSILDDDDATNITVLEFECPPYVTETFSDDTTGSSANQSYQGYDWFNTSLNDLVDNCFEVAGDYHYVTSKSYKTKIRNTSSSLYWNYALSELEGNMIWWESWFACGDASEQSDLHLDFKNNNGQSIAKLKFEYIETEINSSMNWMVKLSYKDFIGNEWIQLESDFTNGYLRNGWYKIRFEKDGSNINYILNETGDSTGYKRTSQAHLSFENFVSVEFYSTKNPTACPMFFWDEHSVGLEDV